MSAAATTTAETIVSDVDAAANVNSEPTNADEIIVPDAVPGTENASTDPEVQTETKEDPEKGNDESKDSSKTDSGFVRPPYIPPHLMGRDLNNPASDMIGTGRRVQKPRLGVKVPYRNLTSQIVSQDEIAQEILERSLRKYSYSDAPEGGDVFFAMKLTHRLANKISPTDGSPSDKREKKEEGKKAAESKATTTTTPTTTEKEKRPPKKPSTTVPAALHPKVTAPRKEDPYFDSKAEELYAEISSTLKEDCKLPKAVKLSAPTSGSPKKLVNGSASTPTPAAPEQEMDEDTLLAILEGTNDLNESVTTVATVTPGSTVVPIPSAPASTPLPSEPVATTTATASPATVSTTPASATKSDDTPRRKRRIKPVLDPNVEKELALKQLMDFETKKSLDRLKRVYKKPKTDDETQNSGENKQPAAENSGEPAEKKVPVKRDYSLGSAPKRIPKKYQRIIKRQLRSSKLKSKSLSPDQPQKKLPEVPEVQIAIDKYIKTYTNKRKHKPVNASGDTPSEKKMKEANNVSTAAAAAAAAAPPTQQQPSDAKAKAPAEMPMDVDSADENRNEADTSDLEAKRDDDNTPKPKANSKVMREINRLLGDEGAINMIYSIEQKRIPGNRGGDASVLPSTRRKKKDLLLKTKLVKNAVLRLSMSSSQTSPGRARRSSPEAPAATASAAKSTSKAAAAAATVAATSPSRKASIESVDSTASDTNSPKPRKVAAEASKIIRRHSSSSAYSSDEDEPTSKSVSAAVVPQTPSTSSATNALEASSSPFLASDKTSDPLFVPEKPAKPSKSSSRRASKVDPSTDVAKLLEDHAAIINGPNVEIFEQISLKEITIRKYDNLVQIILISSSAKMKNALSIEILRELTKVLHDLQKDDKCRIVLVTCTGSSFCQGIDLHALINADPKERSKVASEYVNALTDFTKCLSQFHKLLIAGVHGSAVGLGVTMLPFFDMVYASDKATFYTPYVKLGQIPEAGATLTLPHLLGNAVTSELLFGCRMLTASEALQFGLVTRVLWPDKFNEELLPLARGIASHSSQSMEATKKLLRQAMNAKLQEQLETEAKLLREHWCSDECQSLFEKYLQQEAILQNK